MPPLWCKWWTHPVDTIKNSLLCPVGDWEGRDGGCNEGKERVSEGCGWLEGVSLSVIMGEAPHSHAWKCSTDAQMDWWKGGRPYFNLEAPKHHLRQTGGRGLRGEGGGNSSVASCTLPSDYFARLRSCERSKERERNRQEWWGRG